MHLGEGERRGHWGEGGGEEGGVEERVRTREGFGRGEEEGDGEVARDRENVSGC